MVSSSLSMCMKSDKHGSPYFFLTGHSKDTVCDHADLFFFFFYIFISIFCLLFQPVCTVLALCLDMLCISMGLRRSYSVARLKRAQQLFPGASSGFFLCVFFVFFVFSISLVPLF